MENHRFLPRRQAGLEALLLRQEKRARINSDDHVGNRGRARKGTDGQRSDVVRGLDESSARSLVFELQSRATVADFSMLIKW